MPKLEGLLPEKYDPAKDPYYKYKVADYFEGRKTVAFFCHEEFKPYPKDPEHYLVGNMGTCISLKNGVRKLNPRTDEDGYKRVYLSCHNIGVHKAVMETFCPNPDPEKYDQINHIDGRKHRNFYLGPDNTNLEWSNTQLNIAHAKANNLRAVQENHPLARITNEQANQICQYIAEGYTGRQIAGLMNMPYDAKFQDRISKIRKGESWSVYAKKYGITRLYTWSHYK